MDHHNQNGTRERLKHLEESVSALSKKIDATHDAVVRMEGQLSVFKSPGEHEACRYHTRDIQALRKDMDIMLDRMHALMTYYKATAVIGSLVAIIATLFFKYRMI